MLEKYMAPWGDKVPWMNKVIDLEARLRVALKSLAGAFAENRRLHGALDAACDEIHRMKEENYDRFAMPMLSMIGEAMKVALFEYNRVEFQEQEFRYSVRIPHLQMAMSKVNAETALRSMLDQKERASRELTDCILKYIEQSLNRSKGEKIDAYL